MDLTSCITAARNIINDAWNALANCSKCYNNIDENERSDLDNHRTLEETVPLNGRKHKNKKSSRSATSEISHQPSAQQLPVTQNTVETINANDPIVNLSNTNSPTSDLLIPNNSSNTNSQPNTNNPENTCNPTNISNPTFTNDPTFINEAVTIFCPESNVDIIIDLEDILKTSLNASNDNYRKSSSENVSMNEMNIEEEESIIEWVTATVDTASELLERAVIGGYDVDASDLWIIRSRFKDEVIPGKLNYKNRRNSIVFYQTNENDDEKTIDEFEVCCVAPENIGRIKWIKCSGGDVPNNAVEGGRRASGEKLYIGRCTHADNRYEDVQTLSPGMIQTSHRALFITYELQVYSSKDYEVLCTV